MHQAGRDGELKKEKSPKPELGMILSEALQIGQGRDGRDFRRSVSPRQEEDGSFRIQFESKEVPKLLGLKRAIV